MKDQNNLEYQVNQRKTILNLEQNETEVKNMNITKIFANIFQNIQEQQLFQYQLIFASIILAIYYYFIPFLYGKLILQLNYYQILFIVLSISFIIGIIQFFRGIEYENLYSEQLLRLDTFSQKIFKQLKNSKKKYSFEKLILCKKKIDILECYILDPRQFIIDQIDCLKYNVVVQLSFIDRNYKKQIIDLINPEIQKQMSRKQSTESEVIELKQFIDKIKDTYLKDIIYQSIIQDGETIDYFQFLSLLKDVELKYKNIKITNLFCEGNEKLRQFQGINNSELQINNRFLNTQNKFDNIQSQFETTFISNLVNRMKENNDQNSNVDNIIRELYQENFQTNVIDVKRIQALLEQQEGIVIKTKENQELISVLNFENKEIIMSTRQAEDKNSEKINKKVHRKHDKLTPENIPWSIKLIKDWKRMSIILKNEQDIFMFLEHKKNQFGNDFTKELYFSNEKIIIRIQEIKNGFYELKSNEESGDYRDLKIIQEVISLDLDMAFFIECQLNLENLIIYKKVDHIIQDFQRAKEDFELMKSREERYVWMEGNLRLCLQVFRIVFILISISSISISLGIVLTDINTRLRTIWHANGKINVKFIQGNQPNNICYNIDNDVQNCIGVTFISELIQDQNINKFRSVMSNGDSLIGIDYENKFIHINLNEYNHVKNDDNFYSIKQNNNLICQTTENNINCIHKIIYPSLLSVLDKSTCISANNSVECQFNKDTDDFNLTIIPTSFQAGVDLLSSGRTINCANKSNLFLCWGINTHGLLDIPQEFTNGVDLIALGMSNACACIKNLVICWGEDLRTSEYQSENVDVNLNEIPEEIKQGVEMIDVMLANACAVSQNMFYCWGWDQQGINDIPTDQKEDVIVFKLGYWEVCAQNQYKLSCWGTSFQATTVPSDVRMKEIRLISMNQGNIICITTIDQFDCQSNDITVEDIVPEYQFNGPENVGLGESHICVSKFNRVHCQDFSKAFNAISDKMIQNWNLPSIEHKIEQVQNCGNIICIQKGQLQCQSIQSNNLVQSITTPNDMMQSTNFSIGEVSYTICAINTPGKLMCWNILDQVSQYDIEVPDDFNSSTELFSIGTQHICASTNLLFYCWGDNDLGQTDIPESIGHIITLSSRHLSTCASSEVKLLCWGSYMLLIDNEGVGVYDVPENISSGVDVVQVGHTFSCASKDRYLQCWGQSQYGEDDIPDEFVSSDVGLFSVGASHVCAQNELILKCWGELQSEVADIYVPSFVGSIGVEMMNSCKSNNCTLKNGEWTCWGISELSGIPQRLDVTQFDTQANVVDFDITNDQDICIKYGDFIDCKSNLVNNYNYYTSLYVKDSLLCTQQYNNGLQFCQVDKFDQSKFICIDTDQSLVIGKSLEQMGDSNVIKVSCGTNHGCALYQSGEVHCLGGSLEQDEANLPKDMMIGAYDVRAGQYSTCVLTYNQIICKGKDIDRDKDSYNLTQLKGLDEIIKIN